MGSDKYTLIGNGLDNGGFQSELVQVANGKGYKDVEQRETTERHRTSMKDVTQTDSGSVVRLPRLYIPGETGELAGLSPEIYTPDESQLAMIEPSMLKQVYAQVSLQFYNGIQWYKFNMEYDSVLIIISSA